jgi:hypothetical protein
VAGAGPGRRRARATRGHARTVHPTTHRVIRDTRCQMPPAPASLPLGDWVVGGRPDSRVRVEAPVLGRFPDILGKCGEGGLVGCRLPQA